MKPYSFGKNIRKKHVCFLKNHTCLQTKAHVHLKKSIRAFERVENQDKVPFMPPTCATFS